MSNSEKLETPDPSAVLDSSPLRLNWAIWVVLLLAAIGGYLAWGAADDTIAVGRFGLQGGDECSIAEDFGCEVVHATSYARLFDIPVAWWGFLLYVWTGLLALFAIVRRKNDVARAALSAATILSLGACLFSLLKAYHLYQLQVICPVCVGMYLTNFAITVLLVKALGLKLTELPHFASDYVKSLFGRASGLGFRPQGMLFLGLTTAFMSLGFIGMEQHEDELLQPLDEAMKRAFEAHYAQEPIQIEVPEWAPSWGDPNAGITIVEFSDFQCPACRDAAFKIKGTVFEFRKDIRFYFLNYPIDRSINPYAQRNIHPRAGLAARAAACAHQRGGFWDYHDRIFKAQEEFDRSYLIKLAEDLGWDTDEFEACIDASETIERVRSDIELARKCGVSSTPTIWINGRRFRGWRSAEFTRMIIQEEVKRLREDSAGTSSD